MKLINRDNVNSELVEILSKILDGVLVDSPIDKIEKHLYKNKKFDPQTISTAYSWIYDKMISNLEKISSGEIASVSVRIFSDDEIDLIGLDNYNRILKLMNAGLLNPIDIDNIFKSIELLPLDRISNEDLNFMVLASLFEINHITLPGSRLLLYLSDKVN
jgi:uncharacterized protein Smg (DUF494 family)